MSHQTLVLLYPGCFYHELSTAIYIASERTRIMIMSPDGQTVKTGDGVRIEADGSFRDTELATYGCVLVPGGDVHAVKDSGDLDTLLVSAANDSRVVVAGICNGALLLGKSGIMKGHSWTHVATPKYAPKPMFDELIEFADRHSEGAKYVDENVVISGRLITAKPWATIDFALAVSKACGWQSDDDRLAMERKFKGARDGD